MISTELSMVQHNRGASERLEAATRDFLSRGGKVDQIGTTYYRPLTYNNEVIPPSAKLSQAANLNRAAKALQFERSIAEKLVAYIDIGVAQAAKDLGLSTRRLNFIASSYGVVFNTVSHESAIKRKRAAEAELAPQIIKMFADGCSQQDAIRKFGLTKDRLRRMARDHGIKLPGRVDEAADRKLIESITAIRDLGLPRRTCAQRLGIAGKKLDRIVEMYGVSYPLQRIHR